MGAWNAWGHPFHEGMPISYSSARTNEEAKFLCQVIETAFSLSKATYDRSASALEETTIYTEIELKSLILAQIER